MKTRAHSSRDRRVSIRQIAEEKLRAQAAASGGNVPTDKLELVHELQVHQIELEMQNEELLESQKELEESHDRYADIFDFAPIGYFILNDKGLIVKANITAAAMLQIDRSLLEKKRFSSFILPEDQDVFYFHRKDLLETQVAQHFELRIKRTDGSVFYARLQVVLTKNAEDEFSIYRIAVSDITPLKKAEQELKEYQEQLHASELNQINKILQREIDARKQVLNSLEKSEERYRLLALNSSDMISRHSVDGVLLYVSPSSRSLLGYEPEEMEGRSLSEFCHPDDLPALRIIQGGTSERPGAIAASYRLQCKDGAYIWAETTSRVIRDEATGQDLEIQASTRNVTLHKKAEDRIRQQNRELEILNQISSDASKSLEIDEILASIKNHLELLNGIPAGSIYLYDDESKSFQLKQEWRHDEAGAFMPPAPRPGDVQEFLNTPIVFKRLPAFSRATFDSGHKGSLVWGTLRAALVAQGVLQGVVVLMVKLAPGQMNARAGIINLLAREVSTAIFNARLYQAEMQSRQFAETLRRSSLELTRFLDLDAVLGKLLELISQVVPFDRAVVYLYEDVDRISAHIGRGFSQAENLEQAYDLRQTNLNHPVLLESFHLRHSINIPDTFADPQWQPLTVLPELRNWAGIPLAAGDKIIGFCGLEKSEPGFFTLKHLRWAESLANQTSAAIQNAWLFEQVRAGQERMQMLSRRLVEGQEKERSYIARELHDEAGQALVSLMLELGALKKDVSDPAAVLSHVKWLEENTAEVLHDLHNLAMDLRPATLEHLGLVAALRQYIETVIEQNKIDIQFEALGIEKRLPKEIEITLYRIATEAITNVVRHAHATILDIVLERDNDKIVLLIEDNGVGFEQEVEPGFDHLGLSGMRERAEMLGGSLTVESKPGYGTTVQLVFDHKNGDISFRHNYEG